MNKLKISKAIFPPQCYHKGVKIRYNGITGVVIGRVKNWIIWKVKEVD